MSVAKRVAYNTAIQVVGRVAGLAIMLVTVGYISNNLIVNGSALTGFGQYTIIFTYVTILGAAADFGLFTLLVRELANKSKEEAGRLIGSALTFRILLLLAVFSIFIAIYRFLPYDPRVQVGVLIGVLIAFSMLFSQIIATIFQARLLVDRIVIIETLGKALIMGLTIMVLKAGYGLLEVVVANLIGQLVIFGLSLLWARSLATLRLGIDTELWRYMSPQFWSIALINILALIHFKTDSLLLTFFKPAADVGIYGVAYKIFEVILIVPSIFATNLLPVLSNFFTEGRLSEMGSIVRRSSAILLIIASCLAIFVLIFAPWIIVFITQPVFVSSALPLKILAVSILFVFMTTLLSQSIIATREQQSLVKGYIAVALINIAINLYAIPAYSYIGAAVTTVITEALLLIFTFIIARQKIVHVINWGVMLRIFAATILTGITLRFIFAPEHSDLLVSLDSSRVNLAFFLIGSAIVTVLAFVVALWLSMGGSINRVKGLVRLS